MKAFPPPIATSILGKSNLRAAMKERRANLTSEMRLCAAQAIAQSGCDLATQLKPRCIGLYAPLPMELDCFPLAAALYARGFALALPIAGAKAQPLDFRAWQPNDPLATGAFGVREPNKNALSVQPDLLFVPLLAFDARGGRLGYGGGYYDATIAALRSGGTCIVAGLAFSAQQTAAAPLESHDERLDFALTERETWRFPAIG